MTWTWRAGVNSVAGHDDLDRARSSIVCTRGAAELAVAPEPAHQMFACEPSGSRRPGEPGRSTAKGADGSRTRGGRYCMHTRRSFILTCFAATVAEPLRAQDGGDITGTWRFYFTL